MRGGCVAILGLMLSISSAIAEGRLSSQVAAEAWDSQNAPGHGVVMLAYDEFHPSGWRWAVEYNTDTLRMEFDGLQLSEGHVLGARLTGELFLAHLMSDYFIDGESDPTRGFRASYVGGQVWVQSRLSQHWFLTSEMGVRQWWFQPGKKTAAEFVLPQDTLVFEPRLRLTYWGLKSDAGYQDRFRFFGRDRGVAFGVSFEPNWSMNTKAWGAVDADAFDPVDPRNDPGAFHGSVHQWLKAGAELTPGLRLQVSEEAQRQVNSDDLYRRSIGGMTPYVVGIPGVPWAYFHSSDYLGGMAGLHWMVAPDVEIGPVIGAVALRDVHRVGEDVFSMVWGTGLALDWRWPHWQLDIRGGYAPGLIAHHPSQKAWSVLVALGYGRKVN